MKTLEGRVLRGERLEATSIGIEGGRIVKVQRGLRGDEDHRDFGDALILPGGIDVHVHFRDPGMTRKEDFSTGTLAAACGGITTVLDMPNTQPPCVDLRTFGQKLAGVQGKAYVDFGLYVGLATGRDPRGLGAMAAGYKVYMAETTGGMVVPGRAAVAAVVQPIASQGRVVSFHAEDQASLGSTEPHDLAGHLRNRPPGAEAKAIGDLRGLELPRGHVAHVTTVEALGLARSLGLTTEATPHHLLLDAGRKDLGALGKVNPPLRTPGDRAALWQAFVRGEVDLLASDHAPHTLDEKAEFPTAPSGMPGVETMYPLMLAQAQRGLVELRRTVDCLAMAPARIFGLMNKGAIEVGRDADLIVVDPRARRRIRGEDLHSKCGWTAFEGWDGIFPSAVYLRGEIIVEDGEPLAQHGGTFLRPGVPSDGSPGSDAGGGGDGA